MSAVITTTSVQLQCDLYWTRVGQSTQHINTIGIFQRLTASGDLNADAALDDRAALVALRGGNVVHNETRTHCSTTIYSFIYYENRTQSTESSS